MHPGASPGFFDEAHDQSAALDLRQSTFDQIHDAPDPQLERTCSRRGPEALGRHPTHVVEGVSALGARSGATTWHRLIQHVQADSFDVFVTLDAPPTDST